MDLSGKSTTDGGAAARARAHPFLAGAVAVMLIAALATPAAAKHAKSDAAKTNAIDACRELYLKPTVLKPLSQAPVAPPAGPATTKPASAASTPARTPVLIPPLPPKPAKGAVYRDADGTCAVRVTQHDAEAPKNFARNDYSRRQPFNADDTRLVVYGSGGEWYLYDATTLAFVEQLDGPAGDAEIQWDPTDPNVLYYMPNNGGLSIQRLDVRTNRSKEVANFEGKLPWPNAKRLWTKSEGSPSRDNRYWGFLAETDDFKMLGFVIYDLAEHRVVATRSTSDMPDHVSMTPSGRWFTSSGDATFAWSADFKQKKKLHHTSEHSDLAVGANGHDYYVSIDFQSDNGDVFFVDIDACPAVPADADPKSTPECPRTVLFPTYDNGSHASFHFSAKAYNKPGWVLVSTYGTVPSRSGVWPWFTDRLFALELTSAPRAFAIGHHRSTGESYWAEPHPTPDRTFSRVVFNSNWEKPRDPKLDRAAPDDVDEYMIVLPDDALPKSR